MKLTDSLNNFTIEKKYLLAVSGGVDSMVLLHLLYNSPYRFSVVHCNFQLRGEDSNLDEKMVSKYCNDHEIELFVKSFDTLQIKKNRESIEMVARNLRYSYFRELIKGYHFDYLITAHHLNDNVETFFINLLRGSGIKGLSGMQMDTNCILRPLLPFTRKEIIKFARENAIFWREDASNHTLEYLRNKIRHKIIPELIDISPDFLHQVEKSMSILHETQTFLESKVHELQKKAEVFVEEGIKAYSLEKLLQADFILSYHLLSGYGFTNKKDCINILTSKTGRIFESQGYKAWVDRGKLLVTDRKNSKISNINLLIHSVPFVLKQPFEFTCYVVEGDKPMDGESVDFEKIEFPLILRNWKEGDFFYPINGLGKKKVSKYLKDHKVSNYQKEKVFVLCNNSGEIIWLIGFRLDDRFKISNSTQTFLYLNYKA
ncbi:MAG: tRNA lysidine(34) synthetase TilS [Apibacter sp.]|nr:tRNA lysidine(34) synthetase TilS [Apibacter sp.]